VELERLTDEFWSNGYLVLNDFFDHGLMDRLDGLIRGHFGDDPEYRHQVVLRPREGTLVLRHGPVT
jgi:hypothetical protein